MMKRMRKVMALFVVVAMLFNLCPLSVTADVRRNNIPASLGNANIQSSNDDKGDKSAANQGATDAQVKNENKAASDAQAKNENKATSDAKTNIDKEDVSDSTQIQADTSASEKTEETTATEKAADNKEASTEAVTDNTEASSTEVINDSEASTTETAVTNDEGKEESDKKDDGTKSKDEKSDKKDDEDKEEKMPAFSETKSIDGVKITVSADKDVFPKGVTLSIRKVSKADGKNVDKAIDKIREDGVNVAEAYTFDIKIVDKDGNEIQPADGKKVWVGFEAEEVGNDNLTADIYHITGKGKKLTAEMLDSDESADKVTASTGGFSLYTVEFTYDEIQYVMEGDTSVALSDILDEVGLTGEVTGVEVSDDSLFSAKKKDGKWMVTAHKAFSTTEWMKVTIEGVEYEIVVTDDQTIMYNELNVGDFIQPGTTVSFGEEQGRVLFTGIGNEYTFVEKTCSEFKYNSADRNSNEFIIDGVSYNHDTWDGYYNGKCQVVGIEKYCNRLIIKGLKDGDAETVSPLIFKYRKDAESENQTSENDLLPQSVYAGYTNESITVFVPDSITGDKGVVTSWDFYSAETDEFDGVTYDYLINCLETELKPGGWFNTTLDTAKSYVFVPHWGDYKVVFDTNGVESVSFADAYPDSDGYVTLPTSVGGTYGEYFRFWSTDPYPTSELPSYYQRPNDVSDKIITLYANWYGIHKIKYDANGGSGTYESDLYNFLEGQTLATVPSDDKITPPIGKSFKEWNTAADGTGTSYKAGDVINIMELQYNTVLYAQWESAEPAASVTSGSTTTDYGDFSAAVSAWNSAESGATLKLIANVTTGSTVSVSGTKTLDLNGYGIKMTGSGSVISVTGGASLTLKDSNTDNVTHRFTIADPSEKGAGLATVNDALESGYKTFMGGYITGGSASQGGGVYVAGGTFNMTGGNIIGNKTTAKGYYEGGGVALSNNTDSRFVMTGGTIQYNTSIGRGGGLGIENNATADLSGDAKIMYNRSTDNDWGGGISSFGTLNISGNVKVMYNKGGSAVHPNDGSFNVSGSPVIYDNEVTVGNILSEVKINVAGTLTKAAKFGIYQNAGVFTTGGMAKDYASNFISDNPAYTVQVEGDELKLATPPVASVTSAETTTEYGDFSAALSAWNSSESGATLKLLADVKLDTTITVSNTKTLDLNGFGMSGNYDGTSRGNRGVIDVYGGNLTIIDSDPSVTHYYTPASGGAGKATNIGESGSASFNGGYITGGECGVSVTENGTLNFNGGTVIGNVRTGIWVEPGTLNMSDNAAIIANASYGNGGGVELENGTFIMTGGTISYNMASNGGGGVFCANQNTTFKLSGGSITENVDKLGGGGVFSPGPSSTFEISGNFSITGNKKNDGTDSNVRLRNNTKISITEALSDGVQIGVNMETPGVFTSSSPTSNNDASKFISENDGYDVLKNANGQLYLGTGYTVTFDAGDHGTVPDTQTVDSGSKVEKPTDPTAEGYAFDGWYKEEALTNKWDFDNDTVTENITLYAKWKQAISYTVTFKVENGSWNEGEGDVATADKTVTLTGYEGDTLKLTSDQIPAVGTKPDDTYKKTGSWNVAPSTDTAITEDTTYTYTYEPKASITPSVSMDGWTYGGTAKSPSVTGNTGNGEVTYTYAKKDTSDFSETVPSTAGDYTVKAVIAETDDYLGGEVTADFTISKAEVTAPTITDKNYTGETQVADVAASDLYTVTTNNGGTDAGSYDVVLTLSDADNYKWTDSDEAEKTLTFNIVSAETNTVTVSIEGWTYGDSAKTPTSTATFGADTVVYTYSDAEDGEYSATVPTDAGTWYVKASVPATDNYPLGEKTASFVIAKAEVTAPIIADKKYTGESQVAEVTANDLYKVTTNNGGTDVGNYDVVLTLSDADNYKWADGDGTTKTLTFKIVSADTNTVTASIEGWTYGDSAKTPTSTATFGADTVVYTYSDAEDGDYSDTVPTKAGTWYVKASVPATDNYPAGEKTASFVIAKAEVTAPTITDKHYTGKNQIADVEESDLYTITTNNGGVNAGSYDVVLILKDASNYKWSDSEEATKTLIFKIVPVDANIVTVSIDGWTYGEEAKAPTSSAEFGEDTVVYTYSDAEDGEYSDTVPTDAGNWYVKARVPATDDYPAGEKTTGFVIAKAEVTVPTITDKHYTGEVQTADVEESDLYTVTTNDGGINVGSYDVVLTLNDAANYKWTDSVEADKTLTFNIISANENSVTVNIEDRIYGEEAKAPVVEADFGADTVVYTYSDAEDGKYSDTVPTDAGTWYVKASVPETNDYSGSEAKASFKISKAALKVTAKDATITYGDKPKDNGVEYSGFVNEDTDKSLKGTLAYTIDYKQYGDVGKSYTIVPKGVTSKNYDITFAAGKLTVKPKSLTFTWEDASVKHVYNGKKQSVKAKAETVNDDVLTFTYSDNEKKNAGKYTAKITGIEGEKAANYKLSDDESTASCDWEIAKKKMSVTAKDVSVEYDEKEHGIEVKVTDPKSGYTITYGKEKGEYDSRKSPTITKEGSLKVYFKVEADNYITYTGSAKVTVKEKKEGTSSSSVEVKEGTPSVSVNGLDEEAKALQEGESADVNVTMSVEQVAEGSEGGDGITAIRNIAEGRMLTFFDIKVIKDVDSVKTVMDTTTNILEICIPYYHISEEGLAAYRYHGSSATRLTESDSRQDGTYRVDKITKKVYIYTNQFSIYAIGYTVKSSVNEEGDTVYDISGNIRYEDIDGMANLILYRNGEECKRGIAAFTGGVGTYQFEELKEGNYSLRITMDAGKDSFTLEIPIGDVSKQVVE